MLALPGPGSVVAGKYRVETLLGEGGMGAVFRAHHVLMDKPVAVKWLRPELSARADAKDRFIREAQAAARIQHPNVVDVYDVGVHEGALFMVMELLEGRSLADALKRGGLPIGQLMTLLLGAMEGVAAAHERGIIHRDIKPDNIFLTRSRKYPHGVAKILDFGISKLTGGADRRNLTKSGHTIGTPEYMSMEQMSAAPDVDARADVYSFGVVLYRALTGHAPFKAETFAAVAVKVATHRPPPPRALRPDLPPVLDGIVMKAMAFRREQRYPNMRALIDALSTSGVAAPLHDGLPLATASQPSPSREPVPPTRTLPPERPRLGELPGLEASIGSASTEPSPSAQDLAVRRGSRRPWLWLVSLFMLALAAAAWRLTAELPSQPGASAPSVRPAPPALPGTARPSAQTPSLATTSQARPMAPPPDGAAVGGEPPSRRPPEAQPITLHPDGEGAEANEVEEPPSGLSAPRTSQPRERSRATRGGEPRERSRATRGGEPRERSRAPRGRERREAPAAEDLASAQAFRAPPQPVTQAVPEPAQPSNETPASAAESAEDEARRSGNLRRFDF